MAIKHIANGASLRYIGQAAGSIVKSSIRVIGSAIDSGHVLSKAYLAMDIVQAVKDHKALIPQDELNHESYDFFRRAVERSLDTPIASGDQLTIPFSDALADAKQVYDEAGGDARAAKKYLKKQRDQAPATSEYYLTNQLQSHSPELLGSTVNSSAFGSSIKALEAEIGSEKKHLFGRILTGEIDVDKVLAEGKFEGCALTEQQRQAFEVLRIYANSGAITVEIQNSLLADIGHKSKVVVMDFRNARQVSLRAREFGDALDISCPTGRGSWNDLKTDDVASAIRNGRIGKTEINLWDGQRKAAEEYLKLRQHADNLKKSLQAARNIRSRRFRFARRLIQKATGGDNSLVQLIDTGYQGWQLGKSMLRYGKLSAKIMVRLARMALRAARTAWHIVRAGARLINRIPAVNRATEAAAEKITGSKAFQAANKAADKAADKIKSFSDTLKTGVAKRREARAEKRLAKAKKSAEKKQAWAQKHPKRAARRAARAAKEAEKKAIASVGKSVGKSAGSKVGIGVFIIPILIFILVFLLIFVIALFDSGFFAAELWDENDTRSLLYQTANILHQTTAAKSLNQDYGQNAPIDENYYSAVDLNKGYTIRLSDWDNYDIDTDKAVVYAFGRSGSNRNIPVNEYSTARLSMAYANAFIARASKLQTPDEIRMAFAEVAFLSHYSINNISRSAKLLVTEDTIKTHKYYCNDRADLLYDDEIPIINCSVGDTFELSSVQLDWDYNNIYLGADDMILLTGNSVVAPQTDAGCLYRRYTDLTMISGAVGSSQETRRPATRQGGDFVAGDVVFKQFSKLTKVRSVQQAYAFGTAIKNSALVYTIEDPEYTVTYLLDPYISSECAAKDPALIQDLNSSTPGRIRQDILVHEPGDSRCTNKTIIYCDGDCADAVNGYCQGHTVCLGHYDCPTQHHYCPGHTVSYATGELLYITEIVIRDKLYSYPGSDIDFDEIKTYLTSTISNKQINTLDTRLGDLKAVFSLGGFSGLLTYASLAEEYGFDGYTESAYESIISLLEKDWYAEYGIPSRMFAGYELSPSEKAEVLSKVKFPSTMSEHEQKTRLAVLTAACDTVGKIPYYPGGKATSKDLEENNFGYEGKTYPEIIENGIAYRRGGLGRSGYIHYIWWAATGQKRDKLFVSNLNNYPRQKITGNVQPGDILAFVEGGQVVDVAIFAGFADNLTPAEAASQNVLKEQMFWYFQFGPEWTELNISPPTKSDTGEWMLVTGVYY